ncbi:MAG: VanZ family protein [Anaerolineae bacterium]
MGTALNRRWMIAFVLFALVLLGIFVAAYLGDIPTRLAQIPYYDTIGHFVLYGILAALLDLALRHHRTTIPGTALRIPTAGVVIVLVAIADELLQGLSPIRTSDIKDLAADVVGIILALLISRRL